MRLFPIILFHLCSFCLLKAAATFSGSTLSNISDVSDDGQVIAGETYPEAFRWDAVNGLQNIGYLHSGPVSNTEHVTTISGLSGDGSTIAGYTTSFPLTSGLSKTQAFSWTVSGGFQQLGSSSLDSSYAHGISSNGRVIVGSVSPTSSTQYGAIWTDGIETRFNLATDLLAVSRNGNIVGGFDATSSKGFLWSATSGYTDIGTDNYVYAISDNGLVTVGQGEANTPFLWSSTGAAMSLGGLSSGDTGYATDLTADGSIVVGTVSSGAFLWTQTTGMRSLQTVLTDDYQLNLSDWDLRSATAISADGSTIVGYGIHNGAYEGFTFAIPEPNTYSLVALLSLLLVLYFKMIRSLHVRLSIVSPKF